MNTIFGEITKPHIRTTLAINNTRVLALFLFLFLSNSLDLF